MKFYWLLILGITLISLVSALPNDADNRIDFTYSTGTSTTNYSLVNVNNSQFLQGLIPSQVANLFIELDPTFTSWLSSFFYNYNQTSPAIEYVNQNSNGFYNSSNAPPSGTTISPIQNYGFCYINSTGSAVTENVSTMANSNYSYAFGKRVQNGINSFQIILAPTFNGAGLIDYVNTAKVATCSISRTCNFLNEFSAGDLVSCNAGANKARVLNVVNNTYFTTADNNLGYCAGQNKTLTVYKSFWVDLSTGKSATTGIGAFGIDYDGSESHGGNILIPNGKQYQCNGNCYVNALYGTLILSGANTEVERITSTYVQNSVNLLIFGNDGTGGAGGSLKTAGVIRGSKNGGSTNGGGTPLSLQAGQSLGNNALTYIDFWVSQPTTSGVTLQTLKQLGKWTYNNLWINTTNLTIQEGNLQISNPAEASAYTYPLMITKNDSTGISIWASQNISASGYITRTDVYDKSKGTALSKVKDSSQLKNADGSINHSAFEYSSVTYKNKRLVGYEEKIAKKSECDSKGNNCKVIETETIPIFEEYTEEGVDLVKENALLKQQIYELTNELCSKDKTKYSFCTADGKIK